MSLPENITIVLDVLDRIVQIYRNEDLEEVVLLSNLEDENFLAEIDKTKYNFNIFRYEDIWKCTISTIHMNEKNEIGVDSRNSRDLEVFIN